MVRMLGFTEEDKQSIGFAQRAAGKGVVRGVLGLPETEEREKRGSSEASSTQGGSKSTSPPLEHGSKLQTSVSGSPAGQIISATLPPRRYQILDHADGEFATVPLTSLSSTYPAESSRSRPPTGYY
ncbi:hypothetical protein GW17_00033361 [Ensete ventricosum]|nr:hypothetical protein GW17_00033361 [Ensete ventricosum]